MRMPLTEMPQERYFPRLLEKVKYCGIDMDSRTFEDYRSVVKRCEQFGRVVEKLSTNKGWHFKIYFEKPMTLSRTFEIRYYCGDDYHRLVRDMLKAIAGCRVIDVLFDRKIVYHTNIVDKLKEEIEGGKK